MEILFKLRENLLNVGIAGINIIEQDFRLKNNIEQLSNICENIPPLKKAYSLCLKLLQEENKTNIYLDLLALIDAILVTQGKNIKTENLEEINTYDLDIQENLYSQVEGIITALSTKSSGRAYDIKQILEINNKIVLDPRVINYAINSLQDSYYEIPILIKDCFKEVGDEKLANILKDGFSLKGKNMHHRVEIIGNIRKEKENEFYLSLLEESKDALRKEAIKCLSYDKSNREVLLDLYKIKTKKGLETLPYVLFSLAKIGDENDNIIKDIFRGSLNSYLKEDCIGCSCFKCDENKTCNHKSKRCDMDCSLNEILAGDIDIIDYLNKNINYGESDLLASIYAEMLEKDLEKYEKTLNLVNFIKEPVKNKKVYMNILRKFCGFYSDALEELYFKYLNRNKKCIQLLLSEMLVYNILSSKDKRFIELAFRINKEDKEEMFISSYFLASLLTKPAKEVFEEFSEKVFPKKVDNMSELDKIVYETKTLNLQMLLYAIEYKNGKNTIIASDLILNMQGDSVSYTLPDIERLLKNLRVDLYENLYSEWFKLIYDEDRLIFDFSIEERKILFYKSYPIIENTSALCKSNVLGFLIKNSGLYNDKKIGEYIYNYVLSNRIVFSLELTLKCLEIINDCGVKNYEYLINQYLSKNLSRLINSKYYYFSCLMGFLNNTSFFENCNDDDKEFKLIKNHLILQIYSELEKIKPETSITKEYLRIMKNEFGYLLN